MTQPLNREPEAEQLARLPKHLRLLHAPLQVWEYVFWLLDRLAEAERERDELRRALADELAEWNPEDRPTLAAQLRTAEAGLAAAQEALKAKCGLPGCMERFPNGRRKAGCHACVDLEPLARGGGQQDTGQ